MAESMVGLKRSHRCTELTSAQIGEKVTVMGWVQKSRNKGGIIFVDLRDLDVQNICRKSLTILILYKLLMVVL